jgi:hypothetical protein
VRAALIASAAGVAAQEATHAHGMQHHDCHLHLTESAAAVQFRLHSGHGIGVCWCGVYALFVNRIAVVMGVLCLL